MPTTFGRPLRRRAVLYWLRYPFQTRPLKAIPDLSVGYLVFTAIVFTFTIGIADDLGWSLFVLFWTAGLMPYIGGTIWRLSKRKTLMQVYADHPQLADEAMSETGFEYWLVRDPANRWYAAKYPFHSITGPITPDVPREVLAERAATYVAFG